MKAFGQKTEDLLSNRAEEEDQNKVCDYGTNDQETVKVSVTNVKADAVSVENSTAVGVCIFNVTSYHREAYLYVRIKQSDASNTLICYVRQWSHS